MQISEIHIENIRGFQNVRLDFNLRPNYVNIIVAPNGFGKSSISTAFKCSAGSKLNVKEKDKHKKLENNKSKMQLKVDNSWLDADENKNDISKIFNIYVVKSGVEPKAKLPRIEGFTVAKPYMEITPLDLGPAVEKTNLQYDADSYKKMLGTNFKMAPNLVKKCSDVVLRTKLYGVLESIARLSQVKSSKFTENVIDFVKNANGTKMEISKTAELKFNNSLIALPHFKTVFNALENFDKRNLWISKVMICHQLADLHKNDKKNLKKWLDYAVFSSRKASIKDFVEDINGAWVSAEIKERKGRLLIQFPDADSLSNGQRDLLYFGCSLLRARETTSSKPSIFIIDEVFDYLDDANIVVVQYFISKLIQHYRNQRHDIYLCLLTHLDPSFFKGYILKRQNIIYLGNSQQKITETMRKVILERDNSAWAADLSKHYLHYHPAEIDLSCVFNRTFGLSKAHGRSLEFHEFLKGEWDMCLSGGGNYDPFAVCAYVRVQIERCAFEKLGAQANQDLFISTHGTTKKLEFAESVGVPVPEVCLLLGVVYNAGLHISGSLDQSSVIALNLKNLALQNMMKKAINW